MNTITGVRIGRSQRTGTPLPLAVLLLLYLGLLAGDQPLPVLGSAIGSPQVRHLVLLAGISLLPVVMSSPNRREKGSATAFVTALTVFLCYLAITSLWSPTGADPVPVMLDLGMILAFVVLTVLCAGRMDSEAWMLLWIFVLTFSIVFGLAGLAGGGLGAERMTAFGAGPNVYVRIVGVGAVIGTFLALRTGRLVWFAAASFLVCTAILSGSRGGMLALAVALLLAGAIGVRWLVESRRLMAFLIGAVVVLLGIVALLGDVLEEVIFQRFGEQLLENGQTAGRGDLYQAGLELWADGPLVGRGIGSFAALYGHGYSYTHNIVLDVLVDGGVLGLLLLLIAVLAPGPRVLRPRGGLEAPLAATLGMLILVASQFSGTYYDTRFAWFFLGLACVAASRVRADEGAGGARGARRFASWDVRIARIE